MNTPKTLFASWIEGVLSQPASSMGFSQITSDLGQRVYYRVTLEGSTVVLCVYPKPIHNDDPYFLVSRFLDSHGFNVPKLIATDPDRGLVLLEDLGSTPMSTMVSEPHLKAMTMLPIQLSHLSERTKEFPNSISTNALDHSCFLREMKFTVTHLLEPLKYSQQECDTFLSLMSQLLNPLETCVDSVCHRDLHVNNIFLHNDSYYLIDFQDMRRGFGGYDLYSLLFERESLICGPSEPLQKRLPLIRQYWEQTHYGKKFRFDEFMHFFLLTGVQRALKALGNFAKGGGMYEKYIPPTLSFLNTLTQEISNHSNASKSNVAFLEQMKIHQRWVDTRE